jgi:hypothetical protein
MQIGKYIGYAILIIVVIFVLEWFQIVDVPFFEIPDFMSGKKDMIHSTEDVLEQMKGIKRKDLTYEDIGYHEKPIKSPLQR